MCPVNKARADVTISAGFLLLTAWFGCVNGWRLLWIVLSAAAIHEAGHWLALRLLGADILGLRITVCGAVLETDNRRLSYAGEVIAALAGPGANLLAASLLLPYGCLTEAGAHLVLAAFNLLPVPLLDGGRAVRALLAALLEPEERISSWLGMVTALLLAVGTVWLVVQSGGSLWLIPGAAGILLSARQDVLT